MQAGELFESVLPCGDCLSPFSLTKEHQYINREMCFKVHPSTKCVTAEPVEIGQTMDTASSLQVII